MTPLVVNADDLSIHPSIDRGIIEAYRNGIVSSATLLMTTGYVEQATTLAKQARLPIGIHLSLTQGRSRAREAAVPDLVDSAGRLTHSASYFLFRGAKSTRLLEQVGREFEAQLAMAADLGIRPTHVDSHQHVHMHPRIFAVVEDVASRFGIRHIRYVREPFYAFEIGMNWGPAVRRKNHVKWALLSWLAMRVRPRLVSPNRFFGVKYSGIFTLEVIKALIQRGSAGGSLEIGVHPGFPVAHNDASYSPRGFDAFAASPWRERELTALCQPELPALLKRAGFILSSYDGAPKRASGC